MACGNSLLSIQLLPIFSSPYSFSKHGSLATFESYFQLNPLNPLAISDLSPSSCPRHQSGLLSFQMTECKMIPEKSCYRLPPHPANVAMDRKVQDYIWLHAWQNLGQDVFSLLLNWPFLMSSNSQSSYPTSLLIPLVRRCLPLGLWQKTAKEGPDSPRFKHMLFLRQELWSGDVRCSALIGRGSVTWMPLCYRPHKKIISLWRRWFSHQKEEGVLGNQKQQSTHCPVSTHTFFKCDLLKCPIHINQIAL